MKRTMLIFLAAVLLCAGRVGAAYAQAPETPEGWSLETTVSFDEYGWTDLYTNFITYVFNPDLNIVTEDDGNSYYNGRWIDGHSIVYTQPVSDYMLNFDFAGTGTNIATENCYKSALALHLCFSALLPNEADNGDADRDKSSYLGNSGVYLYMYDSVLEVAICTNQDGGTAGPINGEGAREEVAKAADRWYGIYSTAYRFTLPSGISFSEFTPVSVTDADGTIAVRVAENLICTVELSEVAHVETMAADTCPNTMWDPGTTMIDEPCYTKAVIRDADGAAVHTVEQAVVPVEGTFAFTNRLAPYRLDNLFVYTQAAAAPEPTDPAPEQTQEPTGTAAAPTESATAPTGADSPAGNTAAPANRSDPDNRLVPILIVAIVCVAVCIGIMVIYSLKKHKKSK